MHELRPETAPPTTLYCFNRRNYGFRMFRMDDDGQQQQPPQHSGSEYNQQTETKRCWLTGVGYAVVRPLACAHTHTYTHEREHTTLCVIVIVIERKAGSQRGSVE